MQSHVTVTALSSQSVALWAACAATHDDVTSYVCRVVVQLLAGRVCRAEYSYPGFTANVGHSELSIRVEVWTLWRVGVWRVGVWRCDGWVCGGVD